MDDVADPPGHRAGQRPTQVYVLLGISLLSVVLIGFPLLALDGTTGLALTELVCILLPTLVIVRQTKLPVAMALNWRLPRPTTACLSLAVGVGTRGMAAGLHESLAWAIDRRWAMPLAEFHQRELDVSWHQIKGKLIHNFQRPAGKNAGRKQ